MKAQTKETQQLFTPESVIETLKTGNERFVANNKLNRDLNNQVSDTSGGQFPFAVVLSCIDSRVPAEIIFDQGIGDIFSVRVAGNVVNEDVLGSIEYGCKVAGSKSVVVLGHTKCGAVTAACKHVELGNITALLSKIQPAVSKVNKQEVTAESIEETAITNVELSVEQIKAESTILAEMEKNGEINIVGASYDVATGKVTFI
ncbi:carbonic anhydrase family protein [Flavicella sp.]|uniref:carbonic anhydrase family protein n=1 Tax=Flavicella sp. TaxID=2957742 RepID=UPI002610B8EF|nr:carbonic anhydrase family protein [Flavicella sp.]MDG1804721.1 carbonic anhydrase family protein [Flavicella sp.]MDG2280901.1 carbonic anhydrase family protein [Flavicella sp.]